MFCAHRSPPRFSIRQRARRIAIFLVVAALLLNAATADAGTGKVVGRATYEKVPFRDKAGKLGLQTNHPEIKPIVGAKVQLRAVDGNKILGVATFTAADGGFQIPWQVDQSTRAYVELLAASQHVSVVNNRSPSEVYRMATPEFVLDATDIQLETPLLARDSANIAGAFNILECVRRADDFLQKEGGVKAEDLLRNPITVRWTTGFNGPPGANWITHFSRKDNSAFIYGDRSVDSDEFDDFVILHEYGHFVASVFSSIQDSPGFNHHPGCKLDPRVAWSEGWATFFTSAVLNDPRYVDTVTVKGEQVGGGHDLDDFRRGSFGKRPRSYDIGKFGGYWDEHTVACTLWALFDARPSRPARHMAVGFGPIWQIVTEGMHDRRHVTLIDFCDLFVERNKSNAELVKGFVELLAERNITYRPGAVPSVDVPYIRPLLVGAPQEGEVNSLLGMSAPNITDRYFHLKSSAIYTFQLDKKAKVKFHMEIKDSDTPETADLDLWLYQKRSEGFASQAVNGVGDTETIIQDLAPGLYYIEVKAFGASSGRFRLTATFAADGIKPNLGPSGSGGIGAELQDIRDRQTPVDRKLP
ncbi:MAG: hypothetical protein U0744_16080 [Gemmataceae bacterium]